MYVMCEDCRNHYEDAYEKPCKSLPREHPYHYGHKSTPVEEHVRVTRDARTAAAIRAASVKRQNGTAGRDTALIDLPVPNSS